MIEVYDYVVIGSGFGGSVSAMRLSEKGNRVLVVEKGKRFRDEDFAQSTWNVTRYLWAPLLRCFGILQITPLKDVIVLHGAGVGGGSLGYANVLMRPDEKLFAAPAWKHLQDWRSVLEPHYETAEQMLGVAENPRMTPADDAMREVAHELGTDGTFQPTRVGVHFADSGAEGEEVPDPYFGGTGPNRRGCIHCGACMVGCRHNAKNTLLKNYLWFAEKLGARILPETRVVDVQPVDGPGKARYRLSTRHATRFLPGKAGEILTRNVVFSAGALGTLDLLFRCRDETKSLPKISERLGSLVRTNSEALVGSGSRSSDVDYSKGVAITSIFHADPVTNVEPVRYPAGSGLMRFLSAPLIDGRSAAHRIMKLARIFLRHPMLLIHCYLAPGWAERSTVILVMQTEDNRIRLRLGRDLSTFFRRSLVSSPDPEASAPPVLEVAHDVAKRFAQKTGGIPMGSINESLLGIPMTAHILGGCPFGSGPEEGVVDLDCQIHGYPGLYVVDGSIMPANPGVNPSLTITALAEYAMSRIPK